MDKPSLTSRPPSVGPIDRVIPLCDRCMIASEKLGGLAFAAECRASCVGSIIVKVGGGSMAEGLPGPETCQEHCARIKELEAAIEQLQKERIKAFGYGR